MLQINLKYGNTGFPFVVDQTRFDLIGAENQDPVLTDPEIDAALNNPIDSAPLEEIINPGETVLIVVPDATRPTGSGQIVNMLVRRLISGGTSSSQITCIFATGIRRLVTENEKREILTSFIFQRVKNIDHNMRNLAQIVKLDATESGFPVELNRALTEHDHIILIGDITFDYFAGFSGGRKLVCPGLASSRTISETHKLAFDFEKKTRREGVETGVLDGNPVHEAFMEVVEKIVPSFLINTITNEKGEITKIFAGNWKTSHRQACDAYLEENSVQIPEKRDFVIVSCGGAPYDLNIIQAYKALESASHACTDNGTIIWLAECSQGLGRNDFLKWFETNDSKGLAEKLGENYQITGQTAWSLLKKAERFNIQIITDISEDDTSLMRLQKVTDLNEALSEIPEKTKGYILPFGSKILIKN